MARSLPPLCDSHVTMTCRRASACFRGARPLKYRVAARSRAPCSPIAVNTMSPTLALTEDLLRRPSVSPEDHGCIDLICRAARAAGVPDRAAASSARSRTCGRAAATTARCCVSRATPTSCRPARARNGAPIRSSRSSWTACCTRRGAADMKSGLAAMVTATERFVAAPPATIAARSLSCSRATKKARRSTARARSWKCSRRAHENIDWCVVGEPTSGDGARRHDQGRPSRIALGTPDRARRAGPHRLSAVRRQPGARLCAGARRTGRDALGRRQRVLPADVVPGVEHLGGHRRAERDSGRTEGALQPALLDRADRRGAAADACSRSSTGTASNYTMEWFVSGLPFLTQPGTLTAAVERAVRETDGTHAAIFDDGRHLRRTLHRADRRAGRRTRRHQRDDPQGQRVRARRGHRRAEHARTSGSWSCC